MAFWRTGFILRNPFSQEKNRGHFMALLHYSDDAKPAVSMLSDVLRCSPAFTSRHPGGILRHGILYS